MEKEHYKYEKLTNNTLFYQFVSIGETGKQINKIVAFQQMSILVYNVALVDYDALTDSYSDDNNSNNFDLGKIFATLFRIVRDFLNENPLLSVYIEGNSLIKQKLYQRILRNNIEDLKNDYVLLGSVDGIKVEPFDTSKDYIGFIIQHKF